MKASTQKRYTQHATQIRAVFGAHRPIAEITVRDISTFINDLDDAGKAGAATNLRSMLINTWKFALSLGEVEMNVPAATLSPKSRVKRQRLEIDEFMRVCDFAPNDVARRAFRLALMIGHRVGVIPQLRFADIVDDYLLVVPNKRGRPVRIPLSLRLDALGVTLGELVSECRSSGIVSRHLIHHVKGGGGVRRGDAVTASSLSHWFATAYRAANIKVADGKTPASFHELRSLCKRLYMQQGNVDTKVLLSHRSDATAETYADPRGGYQTLEF